jgi:hypothetical protein
MIPACRRGIRMSGRFFRKNGIEGHGSIIVSQMIQIPFQIPFQFHGPKFEPEDFLIQTMLIVDILLMTHFKLL